MERYKSVVFAFLMLTAWSMLVMTTFANTGWPASIAALPEIALPTSLHSLGLF